MRLRTGGLPEEACRHKRARPARRPPAAKPNPSLWLPLLRCDPLHRTLRNKFLVTTPGTLCSAAACAGEQLGGSGRMLPASHQADWASTQCGPTCASAVITAGCSTVSQEMLSPCSLASSPARSMLLGGDDEAQGYVLLVSITIAVK